MRRIVASRRAPRFDSQRRSLLAASARWFRLPDIPVIASRVLSFEFSDTFAMAERQGSCAHADWGKLQRRFPVLYVLSACVQRERHVCRRNLELSNKQAGSVNVAVYAPARSAKVGDLPPMLRVP